MKVDDKSNEIPAVPKLMELLDLKGTIITSDALNTQKDTAAKAIDLGADYVLPVKDNHPGLLEDIDLLFKDAEKNDFRGIDADHFETMEKGHGRVEMRKYTAIDTSELACGMDWKGFQMAGKVTRERTYKGKTSIETQYYISSCEINAQLLEKVVRGHWGIENSLHLILDITFREDQLRYRDRIGAQNLATIRKLTLTALAKDETLKCGKSGKRIAAATDPVYREKLLKLFL
jgi:predicted transposase YbfD/YdcC